MQLSLVTQNLRTESNETSAPEVSELLEQNPNELSFVGSVERVVYFNEETGQCVLDIKALDWNLHFLVSSRVPYAHPGQTAEAIVQLSDNQKENFLKDKNLVSQGPLQATSLSLKNPTTSRTTKKFLKSGAFASIGPNLASILAKAFPDNLFQVIEQKPQMLLEIQGVGKKRLEQIQDSWRNFKDISDFQNFLFNIELGSDPLAFSWTQQS